MVPLTLNYTARGSSELGEPNNQIRVASNAGTDLDWSEILAPGCQKPEVGYREE